MFACNFIFFLIGCAVIGVGIYILVDKNFMSAVFGNALMTASAYCIIVAGAVTLIISFLGCCGALQQNKCMLLTYFIVLVLIFLFFLVGGILAIIFRSQIGEHVRNYMRVTLQDTYGVQLEDPYHQSITNAWDQAQEKLYCCAVERNSWQVYRQSEWYKIQPGIPEVDKPFVPVSCCKRDQYGQYIHKEKCQTWNQGPPGLSSGLANEALHYKGCYDAGKEFVNEMTGYLIGMGIGLAVVMISGVIFSLLLYRMI